LYHKVLENARHLANIRPMSERQEDTSPSSGATKGEPRLIWATAAAVAGLGDWVLYDANPGINWVL
jgi:hypothetical protein